MDNRLLFLLSKAQHRIKTCMKDKFREHGIDLTPGQMGVLFLLKEQDGRIMSEFSTILDIDSSSLTRTVTQMENAGLLERRLDPNDRRQVRVYITPAGSEQAGEAGRLAREVNQRIMDAFSTEEVQIFQRVMTGITSKFR